MHEADNDPIDPARPPLHESDNPDRLRPDALEDPGSGDPGRAVPPDRDTGETPPSEPAD
jgi:hypothetical protein